MQRTLLFSSVGRTLISAATTLVAALTFLFCFAVHPADAQVFYEYPGAPVVKDSEPAVGPYVSIGDNLLRIGGYGRFNAARDMDAGLELVIDRIHGKSFIGAGGDVKYAIIPANANLPFDWAVNAGIGFITGNDITDLIVPLGTIISRPLELANGSILSPYGGIYVLIIHNSVDTALGTISNTNTDVELRAGASLELKPNMNIFSAFHVGSGSKFYIGVNFKL